MKLKRKFFGRILASLMLLAISLPCAFNGQAQISYRGFVEGGLGAAIISGASGSEAAGGTNPYGFKNSNYGGGIGFSYMLATTHGIQWKNNFFGFGVGITPGYCAVGDYYYHYKSSSYEKKVEILSDSRMSKVSIPVYFNWRYDFFGANGSFKPYVGMKAGAYVPINDFNLDSRSTYTYYSSNGAINDSDTYDQYYDAPGSLLYIAIDFGLRKRLSESSGVSFGLSVQTSNDTKAYMDNHPYLEDGTMGINILAKVAFDF